jgi:putative sterol carrier protein
LRGHDGTAGGFRSAGSATSTLGCSRCSGASPCPDSRTHSGSAAERDRDGRGTGDGDGPCGRRPSPTPAHACEEQEDRDRRRDLMSTLPELIERIERKIAGQEELKTSMGAVYKFVLEGADGGTYLLDLKQTLTVTRADGPAACTIIMSTSDFLDLFEGRTNGQALFFNGKLKIEGDMGLALKLQQLTSLLQ